jgi:hypothetical protein
METLRRIDNTLKQINMRIRLVVPLLLLLLVSAAVAAAVAVAGVDLLLLPAVSEVFSNQRKLINAILVRLKLIRMPALTMLSR